MKLNNHCWRYTNNHRRIYLYVKIWILRWKIICISKFGFCVEKII